MMLMAVTVAVVDGNGHLDRGHQPQQSLADCSFRHVTDDAFFISTEETSEQL